MPKRVYRESGAPRKTVTLGISARRAAVSSVLGIVSIIEEGANASRILRVPGRSRDFLPGSGPEQQARVVSAAETHLRRKSESADGGDDPHHDTRNDGVRARKRDRTGDGNLPDLPGHAIQQGQNTVQNAHRGFVRAAGVREARRGRILLQRVAPRSE